MKAMMAAVCAVSIVLIVSAACATSVSWNVVTSSLETTYTYTFLSTEYEDVITSFHIYAPVDPMAVFQPESSAGWNFDATIDEETGGADLCWSAPSAAAGLAYGNSLQLSIAVPAYYGRVDDYILPGCLGNWGYVTRNYAQWGVLISIPPIPVPMGVPSLPEPASAAVLVAGCAMAWPITRRVHA